MPSYQRFDTLADRTFEEVGAERGVPTDLLLAIREAMGFAQARPDERLRAEELEVVPLVEFMLRNRFRLPVIERSLRVYGESLRRIAETEADWWRTEIQRPLFEAGTSAVEIGEITTQISTELDPVGDRAMLALLHGQQTNEWMRNILEGFETVLAMAGLHSRLERPPAICFLDLTGYTRMTDEQGDEAAAELASRLAQLVRRTSALHGGKPVKWLGDGVMFHFPRPGSAVRAALEMVDGAAGAGLPPAHVGLHAGPVLFQGGDYFGRTVNVAARIADYARQGEVLVSQEVVDAAPDADERGIAFSVIGPVDLKGLSEPVRLYSARSK